MQLPIFDLSHNNPAHLDLVLHGGSKGKDSGFIQKLITRSKEEEKSVLALDFPYLTKGENPSEGLVDEVRALEEVLTLVETLGYRRVRFVTKSLGGIVASKVLNKLSREEQLPYSITVYGYAMPYINLDNFHGEIIIVHGDNDRHGSIDEVTQNLANSPSESIKVVQIKGADHSYNKEEIKENEAIEAGYSA